MFLNTINPPRPCASGRVEIWSSPSSKQIPTLPVPGRGFIPSPTPPRGLVPQHCWRIGMRQPLLESPKRVGCVAKVASGALLGSSWALLCSSSAPCASEGHFGCVLGSILGPSGPQNQCSRRGESIDSRKSAFPRSILILGSKSPLKITF